MLNWAGCVFIAGCGLGFTFEVCCSPPRAGRAAQGNYASGACSGLCLGHMNSPPPRADCKHPLPCHVGPLWNKNDATLSATRQLLLTCGVSKATVSLDADQGNATKQTMLPSEWLLFRAKSYAGLPAVRTKGSARLCPNDSLAQIYLADISSAPSAAPKASSPAAERVHVQEFREAASLFPLQQGNALRRKRSAWPRLTFSIQVPCVGARLPTCN